MEKNSGYDPTAGKVIIDEHLGHPGIKATTFEYAEINDEMLACLLYTSPSPRDRSLSRMPSSA